MGASATARYGASGQLDSIQENTEANAAGNEGFLQQLPWQDKMRARLRSLALLGLICWVLVPTVWSVAAICAAYHAWNWGVAAWRDWQSKQAAARKWQQNGTDWRPAASQQLAPAASQQHESSSRTTQRQNAQPVGTAIVTGGKMTKALHVCRHLHAAGWRVVLVETHKYWHVGARLSSSVDKFATVPIPELDPDKYTAAIAGIAQREGATLFIPVSSPIASLYDALAAAALPPGCRSWSLSLEMTALLDNKARFSDYAASLGLAVPQHLMVSSPAQLRAINNDPKLLKGKPFILKSLAYDSVHRADLFKLPCAPSALEAYLARPDITISTQQPWILQEFLKGKEYSCYTLADNGRMVAHADTAAELSNLNYQYVAHPGIRQWVEQFVTRSGVSGQLCFDFIESAADGQLYSIECNPRTSTVITQFHDCPDLATVLTNPGSVRRAVEPLPGSRPTYWFFNEVARLAANPVGCLWRFLVVVAGGIDAVFDAADPLPFLGLHFVQIPMLLLHNIIRGNPWTNVDVNIGKVAELYGD